MLDKRGARNAGGCTPGTMPVRLGFQYPRDHFIKVNKNRLGVDWLSKRCGLDDFGWLFDRFDRGNGPRYAQNRSGNVDLEVAAVFPQSIDVTFGISTKVSRGFYQQGNREYFLKHRSVGMAAM